MRLPWLTFVVIAAATPWLRAEEQDPKLMDRLLRPDMTLQNDAQTKKFTNRSGVAAKTADVKSFYVADRQLAKNFAGTSTVSTREANTTQFHPARSTAIVTTANPGQRTFTTGAAPVRPAVDQNKAASQREFATRKYEARGKSQKVLDQQHHEMTIDEVRDLLNKNK